LSKERVRHQKSNQIIAHLCSEKRNFWRLNTFRLHRSIRYSSPLQTIQFYLRNRTTAHRTDLMGCTVDNLVKFWVCKLNFLRRHPSNQLNQKERKKVKQGALLHWKRKYSIGYDTTPSTPSDRWDWCWEKNEPKFDTKYGIELPAFISTPALKLLSNWWKFKLINSLSLRDEWSDIFRKNTSKIPGDNGSSLNSFQAKRVFGKARLYFH
jgi:hypothetical protein